MCTRRSCWTSLLGVGLLVLCGCGVAGDGSQVGDASEAAGVMDSAARDTVAAMVVRSDTPLVAREDSPRKRVRMVEDSAAWERRKRATTGVLLPPTMVFPTIDDKNRYPECKVLFDTIREKWRRDAGKHCCHLKVGWVEEFMRDVKASHHCLYQLEKREFERLFGKADSTFGNKTAYYVNEACYGPAGIGSPGAQYLQCLYKMDNSIANVAFVGGDVR